MTRARGFGLLAGLVLSLGTARGQTLALHPDNPHYFTWRGHPEILITSAEHYGAVLNLDFDYEKYLETLRRDGCNLTRTFTGGAYLEPRGAFKIEGNTLAPAPGRFIAPWARTKQPGAADGGNRFDLARWDGAYFERFRDFCARASGRGIVVEVNLFCPFYEEPMWLLSPFHPSNNVNGLADVGRTNVYTMDRHGGLLEAQERMVRKFAEELKGFDNIYYEICNEPYVRKLPDDWQRHMTDVLAEAQRGHPNPKLISWNIANRSAKVTDPHPAVGVLNFHYTYPPVAVEENSGLGRLIGENETGFRGTSDDVYRIEAWDFIIAGGGLFNHLDYSFAVGFEDGTFQYPATQPGGGGVAFRRQLRELGAFIRSFDFVPMKPCDGLVRSGRGGQTSIRLLAEPGRQYAAYIHHSAPPAWKDKKKANTGAFVADLTIDVPGGEFRAEWFEPATGEALGANDIRHAGGPLALSTPRHAQDIALRLVRASDRP